MSSFIIFHNPRCSKSRQTLALLQEHQIDPQIVLYLETPPTKSMLRQVLKKLGISPRQLLRVGEQAYKDLGLSDASLGNEAILDAMIKEPRLIERPIVIHGDRAVLGRPPENVLSLL